LAVLLTDKKNQRNELVEERALDILVVFFGQYLQVGQETLGKKPGVDLICEVKQSLRELELLLLVALLDELADLLERLVGPLLVDLVGLRRRLALPVLLLLFSRRLHRYVQTVLLLLEVAAENRALLKLLIHPISFFVLQVEHFLIDKHAVDCP